MEKIYKVFVSSTYTDLKEEHKKVTQALLESDCIPTRMEMFHAADKDQWTLIKNVISSCDFYIIILANRYGSVHPETKISYTQMEYEYADKIGIPIFAFFYKNSDGIQTNKEDDDFSQKKLNEFKKRILNERIVKFWVNSYDLSSSVKTTIYKAIKDNPPEGWIRYKDIVDNDSINTSEMEKQINELKNIVLSNNIDSSKLLRQINEFKNTIIPNSINNNISTNTKRNTQIYSCNYTNYINECIYKICCKNITFSLNSMHVSALNEITNMMFSAGITALSEFFNMPIKADYSYLQLCKNSIDIEIFINNKDKYSLLSEFYTNNIYNRIYGKILLNISLKTTTLLIKDYFHYITNYEFDYFKSALQELTNIFVGTSLSALSILLNLKVQMSARIINTDIKKVNLLKKNDTILISKFSNDINEHNLFDAYLILEPSSIKSLLEAIGLPVM